MDSPQHSASRVTSTSRFFSLGLWLPLALVFAAAGWRIVAAWNPSLANFAPLTALAFCGAVYFRNRGMWLIPFAALLMSDLYLNHYYAVQFNYEWSFGASGVRALCFVVAVFLGWLVSERKTWLNLFSGTLAGAIVFYLVTNSHAWFYDLGYAKTATGWWQAMSVGHPGFPPTLFFFRNSLASDFFFTAAFVWVMEYRAVKWKQPSLLLTRLPAQR